MTRVKEILGSLMLSELIKGLALTGKYAFSRKIAGHHVHDSLQAEPVSQALKKMCAGARFASH